MRLADVLPDNAVGLPIPLSQFIQALGKIPSEIPPGERSLFYQDVVDHCLRLALAALSTIVSRQGDCFVRVHQGRANRVDVLDQEGGRQ